MKKNLTFSFAMLLGVVVLLSPVSNALEADRKRVPTSVNPPFSSDDDCGGFFLLGSFPNPLHFFKIFGRTGGALYLGV